MSTSKQTFDQVKSILGKLDRSIDAARARRLDPHPAAAPAVPPVAAAAGPRRDDPPRAQAQALPRDIPGTDLRQARPLRPDAPGGGPLLAQPMNPRPDPRRL